MKYPYSPNRFGKIEIPGSSWEEHLDSEQLTPWLSIPALKGVLSYLTEVLICTEFISMQSKQEERISELQCLVCVDSLYLGTFSLLVNFWPSRTFWLSGSGNLGVLICELSSKLLIETLISAQKGKKDQQDHLHAWCAVWHRPSLWQLSTPRRFLTNHLLVPLGSSPDSVKLHSGEIT